MLNEPSAVAGDYRPQKAIHPVQSAVAVSRIAQRQLTQRGCINGIRSVVHVETLIGACLVPNNA